MPKKKAPEARGVGHHAGLDAKVVKAMYKECGKNASETARQLGVSTATVNYWLKPKPDKAAPAKKPTRHT